MKNGPNGKSGQKIPLKGLECMLFIEMLSHFEHKNVLYTKVVRFGIWSSWKLGFWNHLEMLFEQPLCFIHLSQYLYKNPSAERWDLEFGSNTTEKFQIFQWVLKFFRGVWKPNSKSHLSAEGCLWLTSRNEALQGFSNLEWVFTFRVSLKI